MAMTVAIDLMTGVTPSIAAGITSCKWSLDDAQSGTTPIPTPTSGPNTNFSFVKSFRINITATGGLNMSQVKFGKTAAEASGGIALWWDHDAAYAQATAAPGSNASNNSTAPFIPAGTNNTGVVVVPLIGAALVYFAGPIGTTGQKGDYVEVCLGVDFSNALAGSTVPTPTLRWQWTES
jgi:hypothetical protein